MRVRSDLPAWATVWAVGAVSVAILFTAPDMRREAFALLTGTSTAAFALIRSRDD